MKTDSSPLFSLMDSFEFTAPSINSFVLLGEGPMNEYHIAVFCRNVVQSVLHIDYKNPIRPTRTVTMYNIVNGRGSVYGVLFVVPNNTFNIDTGVLRVSQRPRKQFHPYPYSDDKKNIYIFTDQNDNMVVNLGNREYNNYVVFDEV
jgi:hypothetical protein